MESYVERPPLPGLAGVVRTVCIQRTGEAEYVQRHLPTGGVEIHLGATATGRRGADGMAGLAVDAGYADQAHLSRECLRLTGLTPHQLLGGSIDRCTCGHEHSASYQPFLATRSRPPLRV